MVPNFPALAPPRRHGLKYLEVRPDLGRVPERWRNGSGFQTLGHPLNISDSTPGWNPGWRNSLALLACCLFGLLQCQLGSDPHRENFVAIKLDDSLKRFDSVQILILAAEDTSQVIGTVWAGPLTNPSGIQDYRLSDEEARPLAVRVRGFDKAGNLILDMLISKMGGKQVIAHPPLPQPPSVRLSALQCSPGALIPIFDSSRFDYMINLANAESSLVITATPSYSQAGMSMGTTALLSRKPSPGIRLKVGTNDLSIRVAAGKDSAFYSLRAIRSAPLPPDSVPVDTTHPDTSLPPIGGPVDSAFQAWKHGGYLIVNLRSSGLGKKSLVQNFPLLVRLTASSPAFTQAAPGGRDIRFVRNGKALEYEISGWDTIGGTHGADIWVKVDSLPGAADTLRINMYWGNPSAPPVSDGSLVFGSEAGHNGVWHMSESGRAVSGEYLDASGRNPGTGGNGDPRVVPTRVDGVVGFGQEFHTGSAQGTIALPNGYDPGSDSWSFQAWVKPRGHTNGVIFKKGDLWQAKEQRFQIICLGENGNQIAIEREGAIFFTDVYLPTDKFSHLGIVYSGSKLDIYLNGIFFGSQAWTQGGKASGMTVIGANSQQGTSEGFVGVLDELWFASVAHSDDWMFLSYLNQKTGSTLPSVVPIR